MISKKMVTLNPGESKVVTFEIVPSVAKTYQVSVNGLSGSFAAVPIAEAEFYMPPKFTKAKITDFWWIYYYQDFECPITNNGNGVGTQIIFVGNDHPSDLPPWSFELTLQPGETYLWKHHQMAIWPMKFYLEGDWIGDNYSEGMAT